MILTHTRNHMHNSQCVCIYSVLVGSLIKFLQFLPPPHIWFLTLLFIHFTGDVCCLAVATAGRRMPQSAVLLILLSLFQISFPGMLRVQAEDWASSRRCSWLAREDLPSAMLDSACCAGNLHLLHRVVIRHNSWLHNNSSSVRQQHRVSLIAVFTSFLYFKTSVAIVETQNCCQRLCLCTPLIRTYFDSAFNFSKLLRSVFG